MRSFDIFVFETSIESFMNINELDKMMILVKSIYVYVFETQFSGNRSTLFDITGPLTIEFFKHLYISMFIV